MPPARSPAIAASEDRRQTPRYGGRTHVVIPTIRGPLQAEMIDVSLTGCRIRCSEPQRLPRTSRLLVESMTMHIRIERVWSVGEISGWRFVYTGRQVADVRAAIATHRERCEGGRCVGFARRAKPVRLLAT